MPHRYTDDTPHKYRKSFSLMGKVKSCLNKGVGIALLNRRKWEQKLIIFFHTQHFNYLDFFTSNVLFLVHDLIFEVFLSILTTFFQKLGSPQFIQLVFS